MGILRDLRFGLRLWARQPLLTLAMVLTLGLGIGVNAAIFSIANALLVQPLPFPESDRLVQITRTFPSGPSPNISARQFLHLQRHAKALESMTAYRWLATSVALTVGDVSVSQTSYRVDANFFRVFGIEPAAGRFFAPEEDVPGGPAVVVLSHALWQNVYGGDPGIVGRMVRINQQSHEVLGVVPQGLSYPANATLWLPLQLEKTSNDPQAFLLATGRLQDGVTAAVAEEMMAGAEEQYLKLYGNPGHVEALRLPSLREHIYRDILRHFQVLTLSTLCVLLIACANVANLQLARAGARGQEMATRLALGAPPRRVLRQVLTESLLAAAFSGLAGLGFCRLSLERIAAFVPAEMPRFHAIEISVSTVFFLLAVTVVVGFVTGLTPGLSAARISVIEAVNEGQVRIGAGPRSSRFRRFLVISQIALATASLVAALLLVRNYLAVTRVDADLQPAKLLTMRLTLNEAAHGTGNAWASLGDRILDALDGLPGVAGVAVSTEIPMVDVPNIYITVDGRHPTDPSGNEIPKYKAISPDYLEVLGVPIVEGRSFEEQDRQGAPRVVIINETMRRQMWPDASPVGEFITIGSPEYPQFGEALPHRIVGIAADYRNLGLLGSIEPAIYVPLNQMADGLAARWTQVSSMGVTVRAAQDPLALSETVLRKIQEVAPDIPIDRPATLGDVLADSVGAIRAVRNLVVLFVFLALILSAVGIYGVLAFFVIQQTREIGIRMALGADRALVMKLVQGRGLTDGWIGALLGLAAAAVWALLERDNLLIGPLDPFSFVAGFLIITAIVLCAGALPAYRAARIEPARAIHHL